MIRAAEGVQSAILLTGLRGPPSKKLRIACAPVAVSRTVLSRPSLVRPSKSDSIRSRSRLRIRRSYLLVLTIESIRSRAFVSCDSR